MHVHDSVHSDFLLPICATCGGGQYELFLFDCGGFEYFHSGVVVLEGE